MLNSLAFADPNPGSAPSVNSKGLSNMTTEKLISGFQVSDENPILGIDSRAALLRSLGESLLQYPDAFGEEGRPGNLVDYMIKTAENSLELNVLKLWDVLQALLITVWPKDRPTVGGFPVGDAWPLSTLQRRIDRSKPVGITAGIQLFYKLTQWLTYSLMVPFQKTLGIKWKNAIPLTALAEYCNGGLFINLGALTLKEESLDLLDCVYDIIASCLGQGVYLIMAQVLEAGTWKSGREITAMCRPKTKSSLILIQSDGTMF
ncbi:hypothetical protein DPV78_012521 [Talaromyces pinophilus]|nr:hypothetical protein DPV78_012521 [Talaromyces pinophilus]